MLFRSPFGANVGSRIINLSVNGNSQFSVDANGCIHTYVFTVSTLPLANSVGMGGRSFVSDSSNDFGNNVTGVVVVGGGSRAVPVYSDGTSWRIG